MVLGLLNSFKDVLVNRLPRRVRLYQSIEVVRIFRAVLSLN